MELSELTGRILLSLYERMEIESFGSFNGTALNLLKQAIPFDSAVWGFGSLLNGQPHPHQIHVHHLSPAFTEGWNAVKQEDVQIRQALKQPGVPVSSSLDDDIWNDSPSVRDHCSRHGIAHVMCCFHFHARTGLFHFISMYRTSGDIPFTANDRRVMAIFAPHLAHTANISLLRQLQNAMPAGGARSCLAAMDQEGLLYQADFGFLTLLEQEWPGWQGPCLPAEIAVLNGDGRKHTGRHIVVTSSAFNDLYLLSARRIATTDLLSPREIEIARLYGRGSSHKEIARQLNLSPATVRNHLRAIYTKLEITDKAQLAAHLVHL